jgi:hypothetical protein
MGGGRERGPKKAIMAVVASILTAIYHMLKDGTMYHDLGCDHFKRHSAHQQKKRLVKGLADLGFAVELKPLAALPGSFVARSNSSPSLHGLRLIAIPAH